MSIVACVKVQDGIVVGCDSATQIMGTDNKGNVGVLKVFENAKKLFRFRGCPVGILTYGMGNIGKISIQTLLREFDKDNSVLDEKLNTVEKIAGALLDFIKERYDAEYGELDKEKKPVLGLYVAGYSSGSNLGEEWEFKIPLDEEPVSVRASDLYGASWRGVAMPFTRLYFGFDNRAMVEFEKAGLDVDKIKEINSKFQASVIYDGMPVKDALNFTKFILKTTIGLNSFEIGAPSCAEPIQVAVIDSKEGFEWVDKPSLKD